MNIEMIKKDLQETDVFYFNNSLFDPLELIKKYVKQTVKPDKKYLTNAFGVKIPEIVEPHLLQNKANTVEKPPIPSNWHADAAEFGAVLRAIDLASADMFTMCELGCAWGCWMNISGVVAKRKGQDVFLIGVEGDRFFLDLANSILDINGIKKNEYRLYKGVASGKLGNALFPKIDQDHRAWGAEPIFNLSENDLLSFKDSEKYDLLQQFTPETIFSDIDRVDLLHIDIQGGERGLIPDSISTLNHKVAYLCIGTHSRQIEGELFDCLIDNGWRLEIERPAILQLNEQPVVMVDGVQGWRNLKLLPKEKLEMQGSVQLKTSDVEIFTQKNETREFEIVISNQSKSDWQSNAENPVNVSYHWIDQEGNVVIFDGERTPLTPQTLKAGHTTTQGVKVIAPDTPGNYKLQILLVHEGISWFDQNEFRASETEFVVRQQDL